MNYAVNPEHVEQTGKTTSRHGGKAIARPDWPAHHVLATAVDGAHGGIGDPPPTRSPRGGSDIFFKSYPRRSGYSATLAPMRTLHAPSGGAR